MAAAVKPSPFPGLARGEGRKHIIFLEVPKQRHHVISSLFLLAKVPGQR